MFVSSRREAALNLKPTHVKCDDTFCRVTASMHFNALFPPTVKKRANAAPAILPRIRTRTYMKNKKLKIELTLFLRMEVHCCHRNSAPSLVVKLSRYFVSVSRYFVRIFTLQRETNHIQAIGKVIS